MNIKKEFPKLSLFILKVQENPEIFSFGDELH